VPEGTATKAFCASLGSGNWRKGFHSDMHVCLSCNHYLVYHEPPGGHEPCYLCPPTKCLIEGCECAGYEGMVLTDRPHKEHKAMQIRWGSWGVVVFATDEGLTVVNGPEPLVERGGVRFSQGSTSGSGSTSAEG